MEFAVFDNRSFCFAQTSICSLFAEIRAISEEEKNIDKIIPVIAKNKMSIILNLTNNWEFEEEWNGKNNYVFVIYNPLNPDSVITWNSANPVGQATELSLMFEKSPDKSSLLAKATE